MLKGQIQQILFILFSLNGTFGRKVQEVTPGLNCGISSKIYLKNPNPFFGCSIKNYHKYPTKDDYQRGILEALSSDSGVKYFTSTVYFTSINVRALLYR